MGKSKTLRAVTATVTAPALAVGVVEPTLGWTLLEAPFLVLLLWRTASIVVAFCTVGAVLLPLPTHTSVSHTGVAPTPTCITPCWD